MCCCSLVRHSARPAHVQPRPPPSACTQGVCCGVLPPNLAEAELLADKGLLQPLLARHVVLAVRSCGCGCGWRRRRSHKPSPHVVFSQSLTLGMLHPLAALQDASQGGSPPVATPGGTPVRSEAGQALRLFADDAGAPESVAVGRVPRERVPVLASERRPGCPLAAYLIPQVLGGPSRPGDS